MRPERPKIYHIVHIDRLASIINDGFLFADSIIQSRYVSGTTIGMTNIKERRMTNALSSHEGLHVGECVPFYFCPRSIMLYMIHCRNPALGYSGGQENIIHLEGDLNQAVGWANSAGLRWAFTLSNAGAFYFEDRADLNALEEVNWSAVGSTRWGGPGVDPSIKEGKQAEFLVETKFPWELITRVGIPNDQSMANRLGMILASSQHKPVVGLAQGWYY